MAFIDTSREIAADVREVYEAWTAFEDFPTFMAAIETVTILPDERLHWVAVVEDDVYEWDADIVEHVEDEKVVWQALDGREAGEVRFEKLGDQRTKVTYQLEYDPTAWAGTTDAVQRWMSSRVETDLDEFKRILEESE